MDYRVALITGAGSGLGRQLALDLAAGGTAIAALDRREAGLVSLARDLGEKPHAWRTADVTDPLALKSAVADLETHLGPIDLMIACAGVGLETSALNLRHEDWATVLNINLIGVGHTMAAVLPGMLQRRRGHLVALSSLASFRGMPRMLGYCASKAGVNALMDGLRVEVRDHGLFATTICPGWVRTPMTSQVDAPMPCLMEVDEAARNILWAIRRKKSFYAFPRRLVWRLKFLSWLPRSWQDRMIAKMLKQSKST